MSLPATDNFTRADSTTSLGANWTTTPGAEGSFGISTNRAYAPNPNPFMSGNFWSADSFANDHYSQVLLNAVTANIMGLAVRISGAAATFYYSWFSTNSGAYSRVGKFIAGTETVLIAADAYSSDPSSGSTVYFSTVSTTLTVQSDVANGNNGVLAQIAQTTDSSIASGSAGITAYHAGGGTSYLGTWKGDNLSAMQFPKGFGRPFPYAPGSSSNPRGPF